MENTKKILVSKNKFAIIDAEDFEVLSRFSWSSDNYDNVSTNFKVNGVWVRVPMNRFLYKPKIQHHIAYKNKNPLDNRKENLILLTTQQFNGTSEKMYTKMRQIGKLELRNPTSKYKGVSKISDPRYKKKWRGTITYKGKVEVKNFATENEAGVWYNKKAIEYFGETAFQNII